MSAQDAAVRMALLERSRGRKPKVGTRNRKPGRDGVMEIILGPGSWNLHLVEAAAADDLEYIATALDVEAEVGFLGTEFGSFYNAHNIAAMAWAFQVARARGAADLVARLGEWLRTALTVLAVQSGPARVSETVIGPGGKVLHARPTNENGRRLGIFPKGKKVDCTFAGNRNRPTCNDLFGPILSAVAGERHPEWSEDCWPVFVVENVVAAGAPLASMIAGWRADAPATLGAILLRGPMEVFIVRYVGGAVAAWVSSTFNPNKAGYAAAYTDLHGNYFAAMPTRPRKLKAPRCGAALSEDFSRIVATGADGVIELPLPETVIDVAYRFGDPAQARVSETLENLVETW